MDICRKITGLDRLTGATLVHTNCADLKIVFVTEEIVRVRGAVPFGRLGDTLLVAVLNPLDADFHAEVERLAGCPCRFFLAEPHTTEDFLEKFFAENM